MGGVEWVEVMGASCPGSRGKIRGRIGRLRTEKKRFHAVTEKLLVLRECGC